MIFAVFLLCGFSAAVAIRTLDPLTVEVARDLMVPVSSVVLLASAAALPCALAQPVLGPVGDHFGKSRVLKIALWVSAASLAAGAMANDLAMLALSRMLTGVAGAGLIPVAMAMVGDRYKKARQVAIARFVASAIIGQIMGAVFAGMLAEAIGWRGVMWLCCAIVLIAALAATLLLEDEPPDANRGRFGFHTGADIYGRIFRNPRSWACYSTVFATGAFTFGFLPFVAPVLQMQNNGGAREAGIIIAGMAAGSLAFSLVAAAVPQSVRAPDADGHGRPRRLRGVPGLFDGSVLADAGGVLFRGRARLLHGAQFRAGGSGRDRAGRALLVLRHARGLLLSRPDGGAAPVDAGHRERWARRARSSSWRSAWLRPG